MKNTKKVYLDNETLNRLKNQAEALGFVGRGWLTHYLEKLSKEDIVFLDQNVRKILRTLNLKPDTH
jgi:hypothetical protein